MNVRNVSLALLTGLLAVGWGPAQARECRLPSADAAAAGGYLQSIQGRVDPARCDSMITVLRKLVSNHRTGGRQLEPDKAAGPDAVREQLQEAMGDAAFVAELKAIGAEADPLRKGLLEAILLDAYGYYAARDARLNEIALSGARR